MPKTHIALVLDMSGSMSATEEATRSGVTTYIKETRKTVPDALFSLTVFDDILEKWVVNERLDSIRAKGVISNYKPRNMTALYDAIGSTVEDLKKRVKRSDKAIVVIMTDGYENASRKFNRQQINATVTELQSNGNWTFVFLGANIDSWGVGQQLGFYRANTVDYSYGVGQKSAFIGTAHATAGLVSSNLGSTQSIYEDAGVETQDFDQDIKVTQNFNLTTTGGLWTPGKEEVKNAIK